MSLVLCEDHLRWSRIVCVSYVNEKLVWRESVLPMWIAFSAIVRRISDLIGHIMQVGVRGPSRGGLSLIDQATRIASCCVHHCYVQMVLSQSCLSVLSCLRLHRVEMGLEWILTRQVDEIILTWLNLLI